MVTTDLEQEYNHPWSSWSPEKGIKVTQCGSNPDYRYYAYRVAIDGHYIWHRGSEPLLDAAAGHPTLVALEKIPGVQGIMVWEGYQVNITKASAYDWDEIDPAICAVLRQHNDFETLVS